MSFTNWASKCVKWHDPRCDQWYSWLPRLTAGHLLGTYTGLDKRSKNKWMGKTASRRETNTCSQWTTTSSIRWRSTKDLVDYLTVPRNGVVTSSISETRKTYASLVSESFARRGRVIDVANVHCNGTSFRRYNVNAGVVAVEARSDHYFKQRWSWSVR